VVFCFEVSNWKFCTHIFSLMQASMSHLSLPHKFSHPNGVWRRLQSVKILIMKSASTSLLIPKYSPLHFDLRHPEVYVTVLQWKTKFTTTRKCVFLCNLIFRDLKKVDSDVTRNIK
jgi:hypothetical protein